MLSDVIILAIALCLIFIHIASIAWVLFQVKQIRTKLLLAGISLLATILIALSLIPNEALFSGRLDNHSITWAALIMILMTYSWLVTHDCLRHRHLQMMRGIISVLGIGLLVAFIIFTLLGEPANSWLHGIDALTMPTYIALFGSLSYLIMVMGISIFVFLTATMPELANRGLYWLMTSVLLLTSILLLTSFDLPMAIGGSVLLTMCTIFVIYGVRHHQVGDIRHTIWQFAQFAIVAVLAWALIFAVLYFLALSPWGRQLDFGDSVSPILTLALIAICIVLLITAVGVVMLRVSDNIFQPRRLSIARASAQYSDRVATATQLGDVVEATTETVNRTINTAQSALILINNTRRVQDAVELIMLEQGASLTDPSLVGYLSVKSPLYQVLTQQNRAISQFDIEYGESFQHLAPQERQFFIDTKMSLYTPIKTEGNLIGLIASGHKKNDRPYTADDLMTLKIIGQQVSTALRSARLIDDLQHLNDSMRHLNLRLENAKIELEKLDTVKTDFVTIASHELRTPLAQIRGYTDIIDSLNDANALQPSQTSTLVGNLRKSTERMEELISAMIDVSQIDVNSLDLNFIRTSPDTIIKMALDPLRDPASERKIDIIHHNTKNLPTIQADLKRMVQAIRNVVLNAIKFTPDGGRIDISAHLESYDDGHSSDQILFQIRDTGIGVAEKDNPYIFNKFYRAFDTQLHSTGIYKFMGAGPGLGLTIAKGIIEGHGGYIWVESDGHDMEALPGSIFYVRLPVDPPAGTGRMRPFKSDLNRTQSIPEVPLNLLPDEED